MQLLDKAVRFYHASTRESFIYGNEVGNPLFYCPEGKTYLQLFTLAFEGNEEVHTLCFEDPHHHRKGTLKRTHSTLHWGRKIFRQIVGDVPSQFEFVPLPNVREPKYLFLVWDGRCLYVSQDKYNPSPKSFRFFLGHRTFMKRVEINSVARPSDKGTVYIDTDWGQLCTPATFNPKLASTFCGRNIFILDPKNHEIKENGDIVTIGPE